MKNIRIFIGKLSVFGGEISIYLNRRVFVMLNQWNAMTVENIPRNPRPPDH